MGEPRWTESRQTSIIVDGSATSIDPTAAWVDAKVAPQRAWRTNRATLSQLRSLPQRSEESSEMTQASQPIDTPTHISPEQAQGKGRAVVAAIRAELAQRGRLPK